VNDIEVYVPPNTTVLEACEKVGVQVSERASYLCDVIMMNRLVLLLLPRVAGVCIHPNLTPRLSCPPFPALAP